MRSEQEMYELILGFAKADERVRAVILNGSRANPNAPKDKYQDFDIVYVVRDFSSFTADHGWIDVFGERLMLQMPEAMRDPSGAGHFNWMMLFGDGNRLDLTLVPIEKPELIGRDSESVALLDKDGILPPFPAASDSDYYVKPPDALFFFSCCNDFWWCLQNVAKGIARDELPYAMTMFHGVVRENLHDMLAWYIGAENRFHVSAGKMGKYFKNYLPPEMMKKYAATYSDSRYENLWEAVFAACELFREAALAVAKALGFAYNRQDDANMTAYLESVRAESRGRSGGEA
ncbi:MAG: aminoglycoside adenylyltransferase [Clostridiales bacterium]|nr:MAG: aminoglycoside adenylyltransferase [Clostridiales bacterium]